MKIVQSGPIIAWRKHHTTEKVTETELRYEIRDNSESMQQPWVYFQLIGGPTGYESLLLKDEKGFNVRGLTCGFQRGFWSACAGTAGSWDALRVPKSEMERVLLEYAKDMRILVVVCSRCDEGIEVKVAVRPEGGYSHTICPTCAKKQKEKSA